MATYNSVDIPIPFTSDDVRAGTITHTYAGGSVRVLFSDGYAQGFADGLASSPGFPAPQMTVIATFAADFRSARDTTWSATFASWPDGGEMVVLVRYSERNEMIVARDAEGAWSWPFDIEPTNAASIDEEAGTATLQLKPRGGWPPCQVEIQVLAGKMAQEV